MQLEARDRIEDVRLYLSSFRNGSIPEALLALLGNRRHTALIDNAMDFLSADERISVVLD